MSDSKTRRYLLSRAGNARNALQINNCVDCSKDISRNRASLYINRCNNCGNNLKGKGGV